MNHHNLRKAICGTDKHSMNLCKYDIALVVLNIRNISKHKIKRITV